MKALRDNWQAFRAFYYFMKMGVDWKICMELSEVVYDAARCPNEAKCLDSMCQIWWNA